METLCLEASTSVSTEASTSGVTTITPCGVTEMNSFPLPSNVQTTLVPRFTTKAGGSQPTSGAGESQPTSGAGESQPTSGAGESQPTSGAGESQPTSGAGESQPTSGAGESQPTSGAGESQPTSGAGESEATSVKVCDETMSNYIREQYYPLGEPITINQLNLIISTEDTDLFLTLKTTLAGVDYNIEPTSPGSGVFKVVPETQATNTRISISEFPKNPNDPSVVTISFDNGPDSSDRFETTLDSLNITVEGCLETDIEPSFITCEKLQSTVGGSDESITRCDKYAETRLLNGYTPFDIVDEIPQDVVFVGTS
ncbi:uncharacterized protein LOC142356150, partial [Convolutriloba macropyga]|uniref:uncharacterized protein LOC142356150 n=1 Tax=Convolutriloba macropyga TaxID=536237 RepID=UPI003F52531B